MLANATADGIAHALRQQTRTQAACGRRLGRSPPQMRCKASAAARGEGAADLRTSYHGPAGQPRRAVGDAACALHSGHRPGVCAGIACKSFIADGRDGHPHRRRTAGAPAPWDSRRTRARERPSPRCPPRHRSRARRPPPTRPRNSARPGAARRSPPGPSDARRPRPAAAPSTLCGWPVAAADMSGVQPSRFARFGSAPCSTSRSTTRGSSALPAAAPRGMRRAARSARSGRPRRRGGGGPPQRVRPPRLATYSAESPSRPCRALTSAPAAMNRRTAAASPRSAAWNNSSDAVGFLQPEQDSQRCDAQEHRHGRAEREQPAGEAAHRRPSYPGDLAGIDRVRLPLRPRRRFTLPSRCHAARSIHCGTLDEFLCLSRRQSCQLRGQRAGSSRLDIPQS